MWSIHRHVAKILIIGFLLTGFFVGCGSKAPSLQESRPEGEEKASVVDKESTTEEQGEGQYPLIESENYHIHIVKWNGESLSIIADWYTGDLLNWQELSRVNSHLKSPRMIYIRDRIRIPRSMMKTSKQMPKEHLEKFIKPSSPPDKPDKDVTQEQSEEEVKQHEDSKEENQEDPEESKEEDKEDSLEQLFKPKPI